MTITMIIAMVDTAAYDYKHGAHKEVQKAQRRAKF